MREGTRIDYLATKAQPALSPKTVRRFIHRRLSVPPLPIPPSQPQEVFIKLDGTHFKHWGCVLVYKANGQVIYWNCVKQEGYFEYLRNLVTIKQFGYIILGVTSDKHRSLIAAVRTLFPEIPHQHCLVHIQRACQAWLTRNPKTQAGRQLWELVGYLNQIDNHYQKRIWLKWLARFEKRHLKFISERTYATTTEGKRTWWYTHANLRKAYRHLKSSQDHLFLYLDYPGLAKDTNDLEAEFTHLKSRIRNHWGLKRSRRMKLVSWYFHLKQLRQN